MLKNNRTNNHTKGFALVEVLVSILLLVVGILGMLGMQATLVQASTNDKVRASATLFAGEVITSLWSGTSGLNPLTCSGALPSTHPSAARIINSLPQGTATVACQNTGAATVTVLWQMPNATTQSRVVQTAVIMLDNAVIP